MGCGLTLDLTPPEEDAGTTRPDTSVDAPGRDAPRLDAERSDATRPECTADEDCYVPEDCMVRRCAEGACVDLVPIDCAPPSDECHEVVCNPDGGCDEVLIDDDGDTFASVEHGTCGTDCDDTDPEIYQGGVCAADLDGDGFGSKVDFVPFCGDMECDPMYVNDRSDCWDADREGVLPGEPDPRVANPALGDVFFLFERGNGGFDWNCDGMITTSAGEERFLGCEGIEDMPGACRAQSGWSDEIPGCGESAVWEACQISPEDGRSCLAITMSRTQGCR